MKYNRFFWIVLIRVLLITITVWVFMYLYGLTGRIFTLMLLAVICTYQVVYLVIYVNRTNRDLARFLMYFKEKDTSLVFDSGRIEKTFKDLNHSFEEINAEIRKTKIEKEYKEQYLKYVISNIGVGIISVDVDEKVNEINDTARELLNTRLRNLKDIEKIDPVFYYGLIKLKSGKSQLLKFRRTDKIFQLSVHKSVFLIQNKKTTLLSLHNIESELAEKELESWQKLIRVLTHEIMNSVTPITTTATAIKRFFRKDNKALSVEDINKNIIDDTLRCINIIEDRGKGLINFVDNYKSLTQMPDPVYINIDINELISDIILLLKDNLDKNKVEVSINISKKVTEIKADRKLIEQLLINLLKNAIEAFNGNEENKISISVGKEDKETIFISIANNGPAIPEDLQEKIFVPFYTSKNQPDGSGKSGTGIGLSLSRQIMQLHNGTILVKSEPENTVFTLRF
ncbi:PAS domain-containing sensor histidine kinase [Bacteroidota bacterium]